MADTMQSVLKELRALGNTETLNAQKRFGINAGKAFGVRVPDIRHIAKQYRYDHTLALALWKTGYHEARILAAFIDDPSRVTEKQMEQWVLDFHSWDLCDLVCSNLFDRTPFARQKVSAWGTREEEFVKRAAFALIASLAVHDKSAEDRLFLAFLRGIEAAADDDRNFVRKAVNWALRQIGKRNARLHKAALETAERIEKRPSKAARWIAKDAIRELTNEKTVQRLIQKQA